ncbi:MAG: alpha-L-arabinofuranosidase C-terminal domain-containing protein [Opitutaceae bacterium]
MSRTLLRLLNALLLPALGGAAHAAEAAAPAAGVPTITVDAGQIKGLSSPILYGLMTEEINYSYDGGLYGELIANRAFKDSASEPSHWSVSGENGGAGTISLDRGQPLNDALNTSLKFEISAAGAGQRASLSNGGFWGIPVRPSTTYHASFYAKAAPGFTGSLTVALAGDGAPADFAAAEIPPLSESWRKYEATLTTGAGIAPSKSNHFTIRATGGGTIWLQNVSLFPPTYNNRPNGNRPDIMQLLAEYKPAFLRFPGGNYLEGNTLATRFNWKETIGDISRRPGHMDDAWRYHSSDGMGLLEFLEWCEDLKMQPLLAVYAGLALRNGGAVAPGADLAPYVQDALDEIEYVTGDTGTQWGARRAQDGHPAPFALNYVEIGNEDWRDTYDGRFTQIYDAIKARYPRLQLIDSSARSAPGGRVTTYVKARRADVYDCHLYTRSEQQSESRSTDYDEYDRSGPKIFEGEWATRVGAPTPNMTGAIGDAAYMTGLERNSDIVIMASYAPLFVNVSPGGMQWPTDLIGYDALNSYGSPAFYAQVMFNNNRGDEILASSADNVGTRSWQAPANRGGQPPPPEELPTLFHVATRDSKTGVIYLKMVNPLATPQDVHVEIKGAASVASEGESVIMKADSPSDTNSLAEPTKIVPVTARERGFGSSFTRTLAPYSINILKISTASP